MKKLIVDDVGLTIFSDIAKIARAHSESFPEGLIESRRSLIPDVESDIRYRTMRFSLQAPQRFDDAKTP